MEEGRSLGVSGVNRASRSTARILAFSIVIAVGALAILVINHGSRTPTDWYFRSWPGVLGLAALFAASELMVVHFRVGRSAHTVSVIEATFVVALFHSSPVVALAAQLVGCGAVLVVHRRQRPTKLFFNLSMFALESQLAFAVFHAMSSSTSMPSVGAWPAAFSAAGVFTVVGIVLVFAVIFIAEESLAVPDLISTLRISALTSVVVASVGVAAATLLAVSPAAALLIAVPITGVYLTNQTFMRERRRSEELEFLRGSSARLMGEDLAEQTLWSVLEAARAEFRVDVILFDYLSADDAAWRRVSIRSGHPPSTETIGVSTMSAVCPPKAMLVTNFGDLTDVLAAEVGARELGRAVVVAPVLVRGAINGVLMVARPSSEVVTFGADDLRLAEMLASQLSSAMENVRLEQSVAELRQLETKLVFELQHDPLTGLFNRASFARRVRESISRVTGDRTNAVLFLDLDDFKPINDSYGHAAGDIVLKAVGDRLLASIRPHDLASRFGGDEFAVFLNPVLNRNEATEAANRLLAVIRQPVDLGGGETVVPGASIGVAISAVDDTYEVILERADAAMFQAKKRGKGHVEVVDPTMDESHRRAYELELELKGGIDRGELQLVYQSVHRLGLDDVVGYECLLRWNHPEFGILRPDEFMPTGLGAEVQREVRRFVCQELLRSTGAFAPLNHGVTWSLNLGAGQILDDTLVDDLTSLISEPGFGPGRVLVEIAESAFYRSTDSLVARTEALRSIGVGLIVDDLSLDRPTLGLLERLHPVEVKLSHELVRQLHDRPSAQPFVRSVAELGRAVGFRVVAKGLEDRATVALAQEVGCELGQGYLLARPATVEELSSQLLVRKP